MRQPRHGHAITIALAEGGVDVAVNYKENKSAADEVVGGTHEVLTAREVADLLKMPVSTIYELARRGKLPARRLGRTWRFLRPRLEQLLAT